MASTVNQQPFFNFANFIEKEKKKHLGRDLAGNERPYIPFRALDDYWTTRRITDVLQARYPFVEANIKRIRTKYLRTFSLLVSFDDNAARLLENEFICYNLDDSKLPLTETAPGQWSNSDFHERLFNKIRQRQWFFFPVCFSEQHLDDWRLGEEFILPIDRPDRIALGDAAKIEKIVIHDFCSDLIPQRRSTQPTQRTFVLKSYHNEKFENFYINEKNALIRLSNNPSQHIIKYYGCFRQHGSCSLILEHVPGGDLGEYFEREQPPSTPDDVVLFWRSLFQVFRGLDRIHQLMIYEDEIDPDVQMIKGIHEDIRPENILLDQGDSPSPYHFTPKLTDFGLFSRVRSKRKGKSSSTESMGADHAGNPLFSSPECGPVHRRGLNMITTKADIFSMGALISHAAAWLYGGRAHQLQYLEDRSNAHKGMYQFVNDTGYHGCFHDGTGPLEVVTQKHDELRRHSHAKNDTVTQFVLSLVDECMLRPVDQKRRSAAQIINKFEGFIRTLTKPASSHLETPGTELPLSSSSSENCMEIAEASPWSNGQGTPSTLDGVSLSGVQSSAAGAAQHEEGAASTEERPSRPKLKTNFQPTITFTDSRPDTLPDAAETPPLGRDDSKLSTHQYGNSQSSDFFRGVVSPSLSEATGQSSGTSPIAKIADETKIKQVIEFHEAKKKGVPANPDTQELVSYFEDILGGRDQFFFIDDSLSMGAHLSTIKNGFQALACIAERLDPDKVELAFTSKPLIVHKERKTKRLLQIVANHHYKSHPGLREDNFDTLVDHIIIPYLPWKPFGINLNPWARKKVSVYVFTDGNWSTDNEGKCGVERSLLRLKAEIEKRNLPKSQVTFHFVRFGDSEKGRKILHNLDILGGKDGWDFIDVKHISSTVEGMVVGPLDPANDVRDEE